VTSSWTLVTMTGLWQVSGRSDLAFDEAINLDADDRSHDSLAYDAGGRRVGRCVLATLSVDHMTSREAHGE
jgi:hypothetical protein